MKFIHRFAYYIIGLAIGSIFVYFIWNKKEVHFDYLPNARVLKNIRKGVQLYSDTALSNMKTIGLDSLDIAMILAHGDVDFKNSSPREKPCKVYHINGKPKAKNITLIIKKCDTVSTIDKVILRSK